MPHIVSTLSSDMKYTRWKSNPGGVNVEDAHVIIYGGHGVAHRRSHGGLETPQGVVTSVTEDDLVFLKSDSVFMTHLQNGFVKIVETSKAPKSEEVVKDMKEADQSAPLVDKDFEEGGRAQAPKNLTTSTGKGKAK